jgi:hypothetical protein
MKDVEIAGLLGMDSPGQRRVPVEQSGAVEGGEEPLVGVDDQ